MKTIKQIMMLYSALLVIFLILSIGVTIQYQLGGMQRVLFRSVREQRMKGYDDSVRYQVQNVITLLNEIYSREQSGELTETQAQAEAKKIVKSLRYGDDGTGYFWIDATDYTLVAHPILPQNEGQNRHDLKDKNGVMIIQEIMKVAQANEKGGFSEFYFTKSDGVTVSPKRTYSMLFKPWNWVVSSGNYYDDINEAILANTEQLHVQFSRMYTAIFVIFLVLFSIAVITGIYFSKRFAKPIVETARSLKKMENGDLTVRLPEPKTKNEIGQMSTHVNSFVSSMHEMVAFSRKN